LLTIESQNKLAHRYATEQFEVYGENMTALRCRNGTNRRGPIYLHHGRQTVSSQHTAGRWIFRGNILEFGPPLSKSISSEEIYFLPRIPNTMGYCDHDEMSGFAEFIPRIITALAKWI